MTPEITVTHLPPPPAAPRARGAFGLGPARVPFERSVRCFAAMGGPMLVAVLFGDPVLGAVASVGTLAAPFVGGWTFRQRWRRLSVHALVLGVTYTLGAATSTFGALNVVTLACLATAAFLLAGLAGSWATPFGTIAANVGILGAGLGATFAAPGLSGSVPSPVEGGLLVLAGALWVMLAHLVGISPSRAEPETEAVAESFRGIASYLAALGTPDTDSARIAARVRVLAAWDALGSERPDPARAPERARLYVLQQDAQRLLEAAVAVAFRRPGPVPGELSAVVRALSLAVSDSHLAPVIAVPAPPRGASSALAHLYLLVGRALRNAADQAPEPSASPTPLRETVRDRLEGMAPVRQVAVRTALRVGVAVAVAHTVGLVSGVDRGYWITLTTLLVMQPDPANTQIRAAQRAAGTVLGVAALGPVLLLGPPPGLVALAMAVVGYLLPGGFARSYLSAATLLTLYALMLTDQASGGEISAALLVERVGDTVLGCLIAVAAVRVLWPRAATRLLPGALADAMRAEAALLGAEAAPARERRLLLLRLLNARGLADRAAGERPVDWPSTRLMWPVVVLTLRTGVRMVTRPTPDDTQLMLTVAGASQVRTVLEDLASALETGSVPPRVPWPAEEPPSPLHADVTMLRESVLGAARGYPGGGVGGGVGGLEGGPGSTS